MLNLYMYYSSYYYQKEIKYMLLITEILPTCNTQTVYDQWLKRPAVETGNYFSIHSYRWKILLCWIAVTKTVYACGNSRLCLHVTKPCQMYMYYTKSRICGIWCFEARFSTHSQNEDIVRQLFRIRQYCQGHRWPIGKNRIFTDHSAPNA